MNIEEAKTFVEQHFEDFVNKQDLSAADRNFAPDYQEHGTDVFATLAQEFDKHCFQALEAFWDDWVQIVFPYLFRAAEAGATFFPRARLPEGVLRHDQVRPSVCTRSDLLVWTGSDLFKSLCDEWDYYHAQGFDNTIVRVDDGFTWFLTW